MTVALLLLLCLCVQCSVSEATTAPTVKTFEEYASATAHVPADELGRLQKDGRLLEVMERQMSHLRRELSEVMKRTEQHGEAQSHLSQIRVETDNLKSELKKTRDELWQMKESQEKDRQLLSKVKVNEATGEWMKGVVEELRDELKQLSTAEENSTDAREQHGHRTAAQLALLHADLNDLLAANQQLKADHQRDAQLVQQLRRDLVDVHAGNAKLSKQMQAENLKTIQLEDDVSVLQTNARAALHQIKKLEVQIAEEDLARIASNDEKNETPSSVHELRVRHNDHHDHLRREVAAFTDSLHQVIYKQDELDERTNGLETNLSRYVGGHRDDDVARHQVVNVTALQTRIGQMDELLRSVEHDTARHSHNIHNLTELTTSIYNLHDSTMQLFTSLEGIDTEMTTSMREMQKEVSDVAFNVAHSHAAIDIIKQDQINHVQELQGTRKQLSASQKQMDKDHVTLTSMHNDVLQLSLKKCKERNYDLTQDVRISNVETKVAEMEAGAMTSKRQVERLQGQVKYKVSQSIVDVWKKAYKELGAKVQHTLDELNTLNQMYEKLDKEVSHFVYQLPNDCDMKVNNPSSNYSSGVYLIRPVGVPEAVEAYCDMGNPDDDRHRWTIVQRRMDGSEDFNKDWQEYKQGFGNRIGEYWIGNDVLHHLTDQGNYTLRVELWDKSRNYSYADYENFYVGDEADKYRLYVDGYGGNASDSLSYHNKQAFSTKDSDNDASSTHCAVYYSAGWWFTHCQYVNANGLYDTGLTWYDVNTHQWTQLTKIVLKIRQKEA